MRKKREVPPDPVEDEYRKIMIDLVLQHGTLVDPFANLFGWVDADYDHVRDCPTTALAVEEDSWSEFAGTFAPDDNLIHGITAVGVTCVCGRLTNRRVRWAGRMQDIARAMFNEMKKEAQ
jgi:hypothetical protein